MESRTCTRRAQSCAADPRQAAREFHAAVAQPDMSLVMFFCSSEYDLDVLAAEMRDLFAGVQVVGCTTAGEIGPAGYRERSLAGASFAAGSFTAVSDRISNLQQFSSAGSAALAQDLMQRLEGIDPGTDADNSFAFLLVDGLSVREELVTRALQNAFGKLPLVGGSAGDDLRLARTHVYFDGGFHPDSAVVVLVTTPLPFRAFKTQHFVPTQQRFVVTAADVEQRIVREIDGHPAATAYARLIGANVQDLDSMHFAASPLVILINGTHYVRSIQKANPDGSLVFFCAIEEGLVLRVARGGDLVQDLERMFAGIQADIGQPQLVIGCDCVLRKLEIVGCGLVERVATLFRDNNVIGFNSYGEQYRGMHVNQTFIGIAISAPTYG